MPMVFDGLDLDEIREIPLARLIGEAERLLKEARAEAGATFAPLPAPALLALQRVGGALWRESSTDREAARRALAEFERNAAGLGFLQRGRKSAALRATLARAIDRHGELEAKIRRSPAFAAALDACCREVAAAPKLFEERRRNARSVAADLAGLIIRMRAYPGKTLPIDPAHCIGGRQRFIAEIGRALSDAAILPVPNDPAQTDPRPTAGIDQPPNTLPFLAELMEKSERESVETVDWLLAAETIAIIEQHVAKIQKGHCRSCSIPISAPSSGLLCVLWRDYPAVDPGEFVSVRQLADLYSFCPDCAAHLADAGDGGMADGERTARGEWVGRKSGRGRQAARLWLTRQAERERWRQSWLWAYDLSGLAGAAIPAIRPEWAVDAQGKLNWNGDGRLSLWLTGLPFRSGEKTIEPPAAAEFYMDCVERP